MKNLWKLTIIIVVFLAGCSTQKETITGLEYNLGYSVETNKNLSYSERYIRIFCQDYYVSPQMEFHKWEETHHLRNTVGNKIEKIWSVNPLVPIKLVFLSGEAASYIELEQVKAKVKKGRQIQYKVYESGSRSIKYKIPTIRIGDEEYYYGKLETRLIDCNYGLGGKLNEKYILFLIPKSKAKVDIKNGCGNVYIFAPNEIYILMPKQFVKSVDIKIDPNQFINVSKVISTTKKHKTTKKTKTTTRVYVVKKGDSLWKISQKENISFKKVRALNSNLSKTGYKIKPGDKIKLN